MPHFPHPFLRIPESKLAHEVIDGELIVIHFESGNYYSFNASGAAVWGWVMAGATPEQMLRAFSGAPPEAEEELGKFLQLLVDGGLLEAAPAPAVAAPDPTPVPWLLPRYEKYNDMQQLLLADPIHEVEARGWPHIQPPAGA